MVKSFVALALLAGAFSVSAKVTAQNDTIAVNNAKIEKVVADTTKKSNGQTVVKYYFMYDKQLIPTSRNVVEIYQLCKQYGAECALAMVINRQTNRKRIIRD